MLVGSLANALTACGGFCAGSHIVVNHQVCAQLAEHEYRADSHAVAYQRHIVCILGCHASPAQRGCFGGYQHPTQHTVYSYYPSGEYPRSSYNTRQG